MSDLARRLAVVIEQTTGNVIPEGQYPHLRDVVARRAAEAGYTGLEPYVAALERGTLHQEWRKLLPDITIKESFLFRIPEQFDALARDLLPAIIERRPASHTLRVWSAGCARGEEPATLAIVLSESACLAGRSWEVLATDVDEDALAEARRGEFGKRAVARVPEAVLSRYFERRGDRFALDPSLLERIEYRPFNFFTSAYSSLGTKFDLVFLRNVLIYFSPESQRGVVSRVVSRLAGDGYLFLGHSESLWQLNETMLPVELEHCFAYRPLAGNEDSGGHRALRLLPKAEPTKKVPRPSRNQVKAEPATERRRAEPRSIERSGSEPPPPTFRGSLEASARALAENRLDEARELLEQSLPAHKSDAFAHALHGLIRDLSGESDKAVAAYRAALFLDPEIFQVRFLLAQRFESLGLVSRARNEYRQVLTSLENGRSHDLASLLPGLLPGREEIGKRCRKALLR